MIVLRGLQGRHFLQTLVTRYETFRQQGKIPATFEVIYAHAWKKPPAIHQQPIYFSPHHR